MNNILGLPEDPSFPPNIILSIALVTGKRASFVDNLLHIITIKKGRKQLSLKLFFAKRVDYHPRTFADLAAASSNACAGSFVPL
jgi:hypothetical protein